MGAGAYQKRKNYFINKPFQLKYTLLIVGLLLVVMCVTGFGIYVGMWGSIIENFSKFKVSENLENVRRIADYEQVRFKKGDARLEKIFREAELLSEKERETLWNALRSVNRALVPKIIILCFFIFLGGIFLSHKIAGPMYRFEKSAEAIHDGNLNVHFNVRRDDEMKKTASVLDDMVHGLHDDIAKLKESSSQLDEKVDIITKNISREEAEEIKRIVGEIDIVLSRYKT